MPRTNYAKPFFLWCIRLVFPQVNALQNNALLILPYIRPYSVFSWWILTPLNCNLEYESVKWFISFLKFNSLRWNITHTWSWFIQTALHIDCFPAGILGFLLNGLVMVCFLLMGSSNRKKIPNTLLFHQSLVDVASCVGKYIFFMEDCQLRNLVFYFRPKCGPVLFYFIYCPLFFLLPALILPSIYWLKSVQ